MEVTKEVSNAAKSAFTVRNMLYILLSVVGLFLIANIFGWTQWLLFPKDTAQAAWEKYRGKASVLICFATAAAATATNSLML